MIIKSYIYISLLSIGFFSPVIIAQEKNQSQQEVLQDDLGNVSDEFQEHFFEALKQKAIENYDKALLELEICRKLQPDNAVVFFEMGKNYKFQKKYENAIASLQQANRLKPNKQDILVELLDSYRLHKDFKPAILIAKSLIAFDDKYYQDLSSLYFESEQYDKLLSLLDKLDAELGVSEFRYAMRQEIYKATKNTSGEIQTLKESIELNPENETSYLNLIFVYSTQGMTKEAFETAAQMQQIFPNSKVVHLALYKFYLESQDFGAAFNSMKIVLGSEEIAADAKFRVLNDFVLFVKDNPQYENKVKEVADLFAETEGDPLIYQKLGAYYLMKNEKELALSFYERGLASGIDNFDLLKNTLLLQLDLNNFKEAAALSTNGLEIFPAQPFLYLINGTSLNKLQAYKQAKEILTFGLDYLLEDQIMSSDFYEQLAIAHKGLGDEVKANEYHQQALKFKKTIN
ncbi:tetratricopeptide repeat protein [Gillisia sp. Hel_I_29]|uniref:tetratricopeptide repeat protein n=1 Tax=Gillisia sp. Hel_I_29 TaxID=1249975 RepID=UPI00068DDBBE|nr:hypothetical protein [Gillisia sp. Hel_I_29]